MEILSPQASHITKMQIMRQMKARASKLSCFASSIMILIIIIISLGTKGLSTPMKAIIGLKEEEPVNCSHFIGVENKKALNHFKSISLTKEQALIKLLFHENQMQKQIVTMDTIGGLFFQRNWEPSYSCTTIARMGCPGDGGKWICDPQHYLEMNECIVYSFGSNDDFSFEESIHNFNPECKIYTFDPTVQNPKNKPPFVNYYPWGLAGHDLKEKSLFTVKTIMNLLGHKKITVLKVDCEGCEFESFNIHSFPVYKGAINQILVEVHFNGNPNTVHSFFLFLSNRGYAIFNKEANIQNSNGYYVEYALVHLEHHTGPNP